MQDTWLLISEVVIVAFVHTSFFPDHQPDIESFVYQLDISFDIMAKLVELLLICYKIICKISLNEKLQASIYTVYV